MKIRLPLLLPFLLLLASCSLEDDRDECCFRNTVLFRYNYRGADRFREYISGMRYFLFDGDGGFVREMQPMAGNMAQVNIAGLEAGSYTLIGLGNLVDYATLEGHAEGGLKAFRLQVSDWYDTTRTVFASGDRLYWGECRFTVVTGESNAFLGEMSNVHCVLRVRVEWERMPGFSDGYGYRLDGIGTGMEMHGGNATAIDIKTFPKVSGYSGSMQKDVTLRRMALEETVITLRWGKDDMPRFRLMHDGETASKVVDIGYVFGRWGWHPENTPVQEYAILLYIRDDGSIEVKQGLDAGVSDWIDGGTIG